MNRPWMPLYIADYLRDTSHLRAGESGAYLHLIMAYWISGRLPNDDRQLATIAKMTDREWKNAKSTLAAFFGPNWSSHKRIDAELSKTAEVSAKRKQAAEQKWSKRDANASANAYTLHTTQFTKKEDDDEARPPLISDASNKLADEIATIVGHPLDFVPPAWCGAGYTTQKWLDAGWPREIILASVAEQMQRRKGDPPDRITYFEKGIAAAIGRQNAPLPTVKIIEGETVNVRRNAETQSLSAYAREQADIAHDAFTRGVDVREESGGSPVRLVSVRESP